MKLEIARALPQLNALTRDLRRILTAPDHRRAVLAGAVACLALGFWYFGIVQPAADRVAAFRARLEGALRELQSAQRPSDAAEVKARVAALEARVRATLGRMSQDVQLVEVLKQLSVHAARYQIAVERIDVKAAEVGPKPADGSSGQPEPEKKTTPLEIQTQTLELSLSCSYEAAARFVDALKTLPAFVTVTTLKVDRDPGTFPNLKVHLTLKFHSLKQLPEELTRT